METTPVLWFSASQRNLCLNTQRVVEQWKVMNAFIRVQRRALHSFRANDKRVQNPDQASARSTALGVWALLHVKALVQGPSG